MFMYHDGLLKQLTRKKQEELNGGSFDEIRKGRIKAVKAQCGECRGCTGYRPTYIEGSCDGMLSPAERAWIKAQIEMPKSA